MTIITQNIYSEVVGKLREVVADYANCRGRFLTEDDIKCYAYKKLYEIPMLSEIEMTADGGERGTSIHAEVKWFDDDGQLMIKPDITILNVQQLSILRSMDVQMTLPAKGFHSIGNGIVVEIKYYRDDSSMTSREYSRLIEDLEKLDCSKI